MIYKLQVRTQNKWYNSSFNAWVNPKCLRDVCIECVRFYETSSGIEYRIVTKNHETIVLSLPL